MPPDRSSVHADVHLDLELTVGNPSSLFHRVNYPSSLLEPSRFDQKPDRFGCRATYARTADHVALLPDNSSQNGRKVQPVLAA